MAEPSDNRKMAKAAWLEARSFASLWLALICLVGCAVLIGGPWAMAFLKKVFGPAAENPGRVITLDMIFTLPFAVYFWIQQRKLDEDKKPAPDPVNANPAAPS